MYIHRFQRLVSDFDINLVKNCECSVPQKTFFRLINTLFLLSNPFNWSNFISKSLTKISNLDRFDSNSLVASLTPNFMTLANQRTQKEKDTKKSELSNVVQHITTTLASQVEKEVQQQQQEQQNQCNNNNANSSSSDGSNGRRRPAIQCHKCTHCAAPDCAK